jgi:two-component system, NarL family, nitrate/nitrite response regulator NarL
MPTGPDDDAVLVIEDHALFAETLAIALRLEGYDVRRPTLRRDLDLLALANRMRPRLALLDLDLGEFGDGTELIAPLARGGTDVVVVTASADRAEWGGCLHRGARTVLNKNAPLESMTTTVRRLFLGLPVISRREREALLEEWRRGRQADDVLRDRFARLTHRERQVLGELVEGRGVHEIAASDVVSEATVRTQVKSILAKLEVSSQLAAVGLAHRMGWRDRRRHVTQAEPGGT